MDQIRAGFGSMKTRTREFPVLNQDSGLYGEPSINSSRVATFRWVDLHSLRTKRKGGLEFRRAVLCGEKCKNRRIRFEDKGRCSPTGRLRSERTT